MAAERGNSMTFADGSGANGSGTCSGYRSGLGACVWRGSAKLVAPSARGSCWAGNVEFCWARAGGVATAATPISAVPVPAEAAPAFFTAAGAVNASATVSQMLTAFPQYSGVSDTYGNVGNFSYNSLQVVLNQRMHNGLSYNINYTYSKNLGDDSTIRSGFDIPAGAISGGTKSYKQDRMDRSWTTISRPHLIHAYGVYELPFGK